MDRRAHPVPGLALLLEVARFLREARYGERVQHPNVVRTIEIGEAGPGLHFLAIEWAAGEILAAFINQVKAQSGKKIDVPTAATLTRDATRIVAVLGS